MFLFLAAVFLVAVFRVAVFLVAVLLVAVFLRTTPQAPHAFAFIMSGGRGCAPWREDPNVRVDNGQSGIFPYRSSSEAPTRAVWR